jgi:hypothetical protein
MRGKYARKRWHQGREGDLEARKKAAEDEIRALGFDLIYQEWCEDPETPGIIGMYGGITLRHPDGSPNKVKVRTHDVDLRETVIVLEHELHHCRDRLWDCGNRMPFGDHRPVKGTPEWHDWMAHRRDEEAAVQAALRAEALFDDLPRRELEAIAFDRRVGFNMEDA